MIPTARTDDALPPPSRLDAAVQNLAASDRHRDLVSFVERWASHAEPPSSARLAQARALMHLCQPDKAWIRLRSLTESPDASTEVLKVAAELFVARGWPDRAREVLQRALTHADDDPDLQRLWDRASAPAPELPEPDPDDPHALLAAAEAHLARGNTTIGRGLLERLAADNPNHPRVRDLLWSLDGHLETELVTMRELTERYAPQRVSLDDLSDEHTDSITQEGKPLLLDLDDGAGGGAFPALFRGLDDDIEPNDEVTEEITHAQRLVQSDMGSTDPGATPTPSDFDTDGGDTKVVRVRDRTGQPEAIHTNTEPPDPEFDLATYRRDMGILSPSLALEDEDDDLIVLAHGGRKTPVPAAKPESDPTMTQIGREVAHLLGGKPPKPPQPPVSSPDPSVLTQLPEDEVEGDDLDLDDSVDDAGIEPDGGGSPLPWLTVGLAGILLVGLAAIAAAIAVFFAFS